MIFLSDRMTSASGSIGGTTFSHNKAGLYTRARRVPVNTNTALQQTVRGALTQLVNRWTEILSASERESWEEYAANVPVTNALGSVMNLSGQNWFIAANTPRIQFNERQPLSPPLDIVDSGPVIFDRGQFDLPLNNVASDTGPTISGDIPAEGVPSWTQEAGSALLVYQGLPRNESRIFFKGPYRFVIGALGESVSPPTVYQADLSNQDPTSFYPFTAGQRITLKFVVTRADGRLSTPRTTDVIAVTA